MDYDVFRSEKSSLLQTDLSSLRFDSHVLGGGAIVLCRRGAATLRVDFRQWRLVGGSVILLFPGDVVAVADDVTGDFLVEMLHYDRALLREASLQLEHTVYATLRNDRCARGSPSMTAIVDAMFTLLRLHLAIPQSRCADQIVLYQLKAFFLCCHDWLSRRQAAAGSDDSSNRPSQLFTMLMRELETSYKQSHNVAFYARRLNISPKYLTRIVREISGQTPKAIIDHYVIMQLKLALRTSNINVKQLSWEFNFSDESFFCRYFRQRTGMSPQEYRRKYKEQ